MLYQLYELQRQALTPLRLLADHGQHAFRSPLNPAAFTPGGRMIAAACEVIEHSTRPYGKPRFGLATTTIEGETVAVREEVVLKKTFCQLKHFRRLAPLPQQPKLLMVAPMSGHFATLLRGTVEALLPHHDITITDWRDAKTTPLWEGGFDLDDYIDYIIAFLEFLGPNTHVMAVCQPSVPVFAAASLMAAKGHPCQPATLTMMGGPIDTRVNPTQVNEFATRRPLAWFKHNALAIVPLPHAGAFRRVYPGFLQLAGFLAMNLGSHVAKHFDMFTHLVEGDGESAEATQAFYEEYRAVMDLAADFYLQTVDKVFQRHLLPQGQLTHRGRLVDPTAIRKTALFAIEGERDDISGVGQTKAALALASGLGTDQKHYYEQKGVGHYGIFNGRKWREEVAPRVADFIAAYDGKR